MPKTTKKKPPQKPAATVRKAARKPSNSAPKNAMKLGEKVTHTQTEQRGTVRLLAENYVGVIMSDGTRAHWARKWVKRA
jgi:hypothetical protein